MIAASFSGDVCKNSVDKTLDVIFYEDTVDEVNFASTKNESTGKSVGKGESSWKPLIQEFHFH